MNRTTPSSVVRSALLLAGTLLPGCTEPVDLTLPTAEEAVAYYESVTALQGEISGNVVILTVAQNDEHLRRGGRIWAKVAPYIYLFTPATEELLRDYPGIAGVRVNTTTESGTRVATALLARDALNDVTWERAIAIGAHARTSGSSRPTLLEDLIQFGESRTEYVYNPRFLRR